MPWLFWVLRENYLNVTINHRKTNFQEATSLLSLNMSHTHITKILFGIMLPKK